MTPLHEPGLEANVARKIPEGRLAFTADPADAMFIAVGATSRHGDGHAHLSYINAAAEKVARLVTGFTVIVTRSTVPVGTGTRSRRSSAARRRAPMSPWSPTLKFLREGSAT